MKMKLKIILESSILPGSGSGAGAMIDNDVIFDDQGIPYIPAKRIKGCLRDAALEVLEMFCVNPANKPLTGFSEEDIKDLFGRPGNEKKSPVTIGNLFIENHKETSLWLEFLLAQKNSIISVEKIKTQFTELRTTTAINDKTGVARNHSLRTSRYLKKGLVFNGDLDLDISATTDRQDVWLKILSFACANFKTMGTRRNRGTGDILCTLWQNQKQLKVEEPVEKEVDS